MRVQDLAATPMDSQVRFEARRLLPGMAARLRVVGQVQPLPPSLNSCNAPSPRTVVSSGTGCAVGSAVMHLQ